LAIDEDIEKLIIESQKYGEQGKIDDSARCLEEVEKLRDRRKEIELMGSDMTNAQKQQKVLNQLFRFVSSVALSRPSMIPKKEFKPTWKEKSIRDSLNSDTKSRL
jgi:hypothetical protein